MGGVFSILDSCGPGANSPAHYMDFEFQHETRQTTQRKKRMDVMGTAMQEAMYDIKCMIGMNMSDNEEKLEDD